MKKEITVSAFSDELMKRIKDAKTIDCCKEELIELAKMAKEHMGTRKISVTWKD